MTYTDYTTKAGDRWDMIAYKAYGTVNNITLEDGNEVNAMSHIINNNPDVAIESVLTEGLLLKIPVIANSNIKTEAELLPPWKR
jgi:phage tail protein X